MAKLQTLTGSRERQILFKKLVQVTDNGDVDPEWLNVLAVVFKRITESDIAQQFSEIAYALGQIDRLLRTRSVLPRQVPVRIVTKRARFANALQHRENIRPGP